MDTGVNDLDDLEIHNTLPHYIDHTLSPSSRREGEELVRKFGSFQGNLCLVTEYTPPPLQQLHTQQDSSSSPSPGVDLNNMVLIMRELNRAVKSDFIFDYYGTFLCSSSSDDEILLPHQQSISDHDNDKIMKITIKSLIQFPEGGLLSELIFSDSIKLGWSFRIQIAIHIARAMCSLHNNNIIHNDLRLFTLALNSDWTCKLLDLFCAIRVDDIYSPHSIRNIYFDSIYSAPEISNQRTCTAASDIYSFGLCLFEICSRVNLASLIADTNNLDLSRETFSTLLLEHLPASTPDSLRELIRQMIIFESEYRPTIEDVLDWLESLLTETSTEGDPPLPPLPRLPFPHQRKSSHALSSSFGEDQLSNNTTQENFDSPPRNYSTSRSEKRPGSRDGRKGAGGSYGISKADAARLHNLASISRSNREHNDSSPLASERVQSISKTSLPESNRNFVIGIPNESDAPDLSGYLQLKADNLPFFKSKFFFFKDSNLVWCSDIKLRDQPERLHYFDLSCASLVDASSALSIHLEIKAASSGLSGVRQSLRRMSFRSSRGRNRLHIKFTSEDVVQKWRKIIQNEIHVTRCQVCFIRILTQETAKTANNPVVGAGDKTFFCSQVCMKSYMASNKSMDQLSPAVLTDSTVLSLNKIDVKALDKLLIARRNPKTWERINKDQGVDSSADILKVKMEAAVELPQTVEEWLHSIEHSELENAFKTYGYDCIGHIVVAGLHDDDLNFLRIEDKGIRQVLIKESEKLGETYVRNRKYFLAHDDTAFRV